MGTSVFYCMKGGAKMQIKVTGLILEVVDSKADFDKLKPARGIITMFRGGKENLVIKTPAGYPGKNNITAGKTTEISCDYKAMVIEGKLVETAELHIA
jgi:hypothetical protein